MNPIRDIAIWVVSLLPADAPEWAVGSTAFGGIILALVVIAVPPSLLILAVTHRQERRHG